MRKIILSLAVVGLLLAGSETACTRQQTPQQKKTKSFKRSHRAGKSMPCPKKDC
ncbi:hypothetical protein [Adhaeribacter radiodurans]|uniref:Uncharacterized protein n=1 Tax=Adhaeribacter radiodurans TaxID=2745197 RepID=A0A7L7L4A5_9BACT|nr:hypothetical protein [Adhaeribacter radiodurans]QMU27610.1 hypothetical protein HUW48_05930 [Adhaeribacter radiodurans]